MKRILITGVDGFTGRYLAALMHQLEYEVHGLVHRPVKGGVPGVAKLHVCDLLDATCLAATVQLVQPYSVAHLAGIAFVAHGNIDVIYRTNIVGTRNLLEALVSCQEGLETVLLVSSANVYGNSVSGVLDESTQPAPANDYAVSKLAMEYAAQLYLARLPIVMVRPFNYTGVGQDLSFLIPKIISHVKRRAPLIELGNLDVARDFSDVRDVVRCYQNLLEADSQTVAGQTFNVCSGQATTLSQVITMVKEISGHAFDVRVNPAFVRQNEVKLLVGSCAKLADAIQARPPIALRETLRWMLEADA